MDYSTSELCDLYTDMVDVVEPIFNHYGGITSFSGQISTVKCFEDQGMIRQVLQSDGQGRILLIDGGGSSRRALIDAEIADYAFENNWVGIICYGAVRDVDELEEYDIGIMAINSIPVGADNNEYGEIEVAVNFAGVTYLPEDYVYADSTGILISQEELRVPDTDLDELDELTEDEQ